MEIEEKLAMYGIEIVGSNEGGIWVVNRTGEDIILNNGKQTKQRMSEEKIQWLVRENVQGLIIMETNLEKHDREEFDELIASLECPAS